MNGEDVGSALRDEVGDFIRSALAAEEARIEKIRATLFARGFCEACGAVVADEGLHVEFHERLRKFTEGVKGAFEQMARTGGGQHD